MAKQTHATDSYWQIPTLGDRRLQSIRCQITQRRKTTQMLNDRLRDSNDQFTKSVERERQNKYVKCLQETILVKKQLLEFQGLQEVLKNRRETVSFNMLRSSYGLYKGESLESYKQEIDRVIIEGHPEIRRLRQIQKLKIDGRLQGKIVNYSESMKQLEDVLSRNVLSVYRGEIPITKS